MLDHVAEKWVELQRKKQLDINNSNNNNNNNNKTQTKAQQQKNKGTDNAQSDSESESDSDDTGMGSMFNMDIDDNNGDDVIDAPTAFEANCEKGIVKLVVDQRITLTQFKQTLLKHMKDMKRKKIRTAIITTEKKTSDNDNLATPLFNSLTEANMTLNTLTIYNNRKIDVSHRLDTDASLSQLDIGNQTPVLAWNGQTVNGVNLVVKEKEKTSTNTRKPNAISIECLHYSWEHPVDAVEFDLQLALAADSVADMRDAIKAKTGLEHKDQLIHLVLFLDL